MLVSNQKLTPAGPIADTSSVDEPQNGVHAVVIDCSGFTFIDSVGLHVLPAVSRFIFLAYEPITLQSGYVHASGWTHCLIIEESLLVAFRISSPFYWLQWCLIKYLSILSIYPLKGRATKNWSIDSFSCSPPRKSLVKGERFIRVEGKPELLDAVKSRRLYDRIVTKHVGQ